MIELAMELWTRYPWNLYADIAGVDIEKAPLLAFDVNMVAVDQAVALLNPREQSIIQLRYKQRLTFREVAEQLPYKWDKTKNVTGSRVQQLLGRAHRRLRVSPLAGSFLFSGAAAGQEDEIGRKEMRDLQSRALSLPVSPSAGDRLSTWVVPTRGITLTFPPCHRMDTIDPYKKNYRLTL